MSDLGDFKRMVYEPEVAGLRKRIGSLRAELASARAQLEQRDELVAAVRERYEETTIFHQPLDDALNNLFTAVPAARTPEDDEVLTFATELAEERTLTQNLQRDLAAAHEALREDAAGRPVAELLRTAADMLDGYGGGPVVDCLRWKADDFDALAVAAREAVSADTPEEK